VHYVGVTADVTCNTVHLEFGPVDGITHTNTLDVHTIIFISFVGDRFSKPCVLVVTVDDAIERTVV
jgi:hypothetical protein